MVQARAGIVHSLISWVYIHVRRALLSASNIADLMSDCTQNEIMFDVPSKAAASTNLNLKVCPMVMLANAPFSYKVLFHRSMPAALQHD